MDSGIEQFRHRYPERSRPRPDGLPWDEAKHPRIPGGHGGGEFAHLPGTGTAEHTPGSPHAKYVTGTGTKADPVKTNDVDEAAKALGDGKHVELESHRQVSTLLDKLAEVVDEAKKSGGEAKTFDLCKVSVPDTNLFCASSKHVPRSLMPQLKAKPLPGTPADKLPKNDKGEVDLGPAFADYLKTRHGVGIAQDSVDPAVLKASQNQLNGGKVAGMSKAIEAGKIKPEPIFVTQDDYIVDGHHRWAANVAQEIKQGKVPPMPVTVIKADIIPVLAWANSFALQMGIPTAGVGAPSPAKRSSDCLPCQAGVARFRHSYPTRRQ